MKKAGIWLDKDKAFIVTLENDNESIVKILSDIEHFRIHGGSGTRFKGGPQDVVQDSKFLEREKHQLKSYFKEIVSHITDIDTLVIFGPAQTKEKFAKELKTNFIQLSTKIKGIEPADSMTDNQIKAWVRNYYK